MSGVVVCLLLFSVTALLVYIFRCKIPWLKDQSFTGCPTSSTSPIAQQLSPSPSTQISSVTPSPSPSPVSLNGNPGCVAGYKYCQGPNQNGINTVFYSANCPKSSSLMHDLGSPTSWKTIDCGKNPSQCIWQDVWKDTDVSPSTAPTTFNLGNNVPAVLCNNDDLIIGYCPTSK